MIPGVAPRFWVFAAFFAAVFLMGGGSRDDVTSLVVLRPACAFFAAYALTVARPGEIARVRAPLLLLLALGMWMLVQLIPLPPSIWGTLPDRAPILAVDKLVGLGGTWRPISLSPSKTMNSLASLIVPIAALLLYAVQAVEDRRRILGLLIIAAAASAALGFGQLASGSGPLYLYSVTNDHSPVGLFANRNHNAVFLATIFVVASYWLAEHRRLAVRGDLSIKPILVAGVCLLIFGTLLSSQSRAGLLIGLLAIGIAVALYLAARRAEKDEDRPRQGLARYWPMAAVLIVTLVVLVVLSQSSSFDRLATHSASDDIRVKVLPQIAVMAQDNWWFGTGFGSFEYAYRAHEASAWLNQTYLNNAHDDWLQWVIEGGLPALLIVLAFCVWIVRAARARWREGERNPALRRLVAMAFGVLVLLIVASALDYPLRVPSMMLYAILMTAFVADPPQPQLRKSGKRNPAREQGGAYRQAGRAYAG